MRHERRRTENTRRRSWYEEGQPINVVLQKRDLSFFPHL
jgi:hypothetical protein